MTKKEKTEKKIKKESKLVEENKIEENDKVENKKSKKNLIILIIVIILLLAISGTSGFMLWKNINDDNDNKEVLEPQEEKKEEIKDEEPSEEVITFKVIFDSNGGSLVDVATVNEGEVINKPNDPTRDGYTFKNWTLDDKEYDFSTPITDNITLKANWEKNKTSSSNNSSTNNKPSSGTTNNGATVTSTIDKINLNDVITVKIDYSYAGVVYDLIFIDNFKEVFPEITGDTFTIDDPVGNGTNVIPESEWIKRYDQLKFNTTKEQNAINILNGLKNKKYKGIGNYSVTTDYPGNLSHVISYGYSYINVSDTKKYKALQDGLSASRSEFRSILGKAENGAYNIGLGYAVLPTQYKVLDEELCAEYNLTCDRW